MLLASCGDSGEAAPTGGTGGGGGTCGGGEMNPPSGDGEVQAAVGCELPLELGPTEVEILLTIEPQTPWSSGGSACVDMEAEATIPASLGELLIATGSDVLTIDSLTAELAVSGGTPSTLVVAIEEPLVLDVDSDDDGIAEDVPVMIPVPTQTVANDGSPNVGFTVQAFEVTISDVPVLGDLVVSDDPADSDLVCELTSTTAAFPAN